MSWNSWRSKISYDSPVVIKRAKQVYFNSIALLMDAVESIGEDRVKKYYLEVK